MECFLWFHAWGKWTQEIVEGRKTIISSGQHEEGVAFLKQTRTCKECGLMQRRLEG